MYGERFVGLLDSRVTNIAERLDFEVSPLLRSVDRDLVRLGYQIQGFADVAFARCEGIVGSLADWKDIPSGSF
jgi:hypothetical protein